MSEVLRRFDVGFDDAAFDAALQRAADRVVAAAADDTAGARVVTRVLDEARLSAGRRLWVPAAAFALLILAVGLSLREPASTPEQAAAAGPPVAVAALGDRRPEAAQSRGASAPAAETPVAFVAAATGAALPGARRRARTRAVAAAGDDASAVPLLQVTSELRLGVAGGADFGADVLAPPPLPVDALALESLEPEALDPRRD